MKDKKISNILIAFAIVIWCLAVGRVGYYETHYTMDCIVINVENDIVTVVDLTCQEWDFIGEDFQVDDVVKVTFKHYGESSRFDDVIEKVEKMEYSWEE